MRTIVGLVLAIACATGCIGRASGSRGTTIQSAPGGTDLTDRHDVNQLPTSSQTR
jgi:hypothetical protein